MRLDITVRNWKRFQHYRDRNPPWIKVYSDLLEKREWFALSPEASRLLVEIWLIASQESVDGSFTVEFDDLVFKLRYQDASKVLAALQDLVSQEFIEVVQADASTPQAGRKHFPLPSPSESTEGESSVSSLRSETGADAPSFPQSGEVVEA